MWLKGGTNILGLLFMFIGWSDWRWAKERWIDIRIYKAVLLKLSFRSDFDRAQSQGIVLWRRQEKQQLPYEDQVVFAPKITVAHVPTRP